jgi:lysophospholipase L1-like esterase
VSRRGGTQPEEADTGISREGEGTSGSAPEGSAREAGVRKREALSPRKARAFLLITIAIPFVLLALLEAGLRLLDRDGGDPLVVSAQVGDGRYVIPNPRVGVRWFGAESNPPAPRAEPFLARKAEGSLRVVALGESSTYGFPHPPTASFPRALRDMLSDVLPERHVEVINLGIPATNSWTLRDIAGEVIDLQPDAVVIYAGHNEYYGALGVASTAGGGSLPILVRTTLALQRLRTVRAVSRLVARARGAAAGSPAAAEAGQDDVAVATFMETIARNEPIQLGSESFEAGVRQFEGNLVAVLDRLRNAGVPAFVGSLTSNLRGQEPLAHDANDAAGAARDVFERATARLAQAATREDSAALLAEFERARDLDVVRFRAPSAFDSVVFRVAERTGAVYVAVRELFLQRAEGGVPGADLFVEHVHPTAEGYALMASAFAGAMQSAGTLPEADWTRLRDVDAYASRMHLTRFDSLLTTHTVRTVTSRWPFRAADDAFDYRGTYRPADGVDSLAMFVSRGGMPWAVAKVQLAEQFMRSGDASRAADEYAGLVRDVPPVFEEPWRRYGEALLRAGRLEEAERALSAANEIEPTQSGLRLLAESSMARGDTAQAVVWLEEAVQRWPSDAATWYQLSIVAAMRRDLERARASAVQAARLRPDLPGLGEWLATLGVRPGG